MPFIQLFTDNFTRANAASLGNGWIDPNAVGSISGDLGVLAANGSVPWNGSGIVYRPTSDGNPRDGQITVTFPASENTNGAVYVCLRLQPATSTATSYIVGVNFDYGQLGAFPVSNGTLGSQSGPESFTYNSAHTYSLTASAVGVNPTTVTATLTDTTTSSVVATLSFTDSTAALQSPTSGVFGIFANSASETISSFTSYSYTAVTTTTIPVNSPAFVFSPGNWYGNSGRGGSSYRQSWNNGAYFRVTWNASASPTAVLLLPTTGTSNMLSYFLNGVLTDNVAATGNITLSGIKASASNTLVVFLRNSNQQYRWASGATNTVQIEGLQVDTGSSAGTAEAARPWGIIVGDSITEGIEANAGNADVLIDYSFYVQQGLDQLGYDTCISACGYSGYLVTGDGTGTSGDVPAYYYVSGGTYSESSSRWDKICQGLSILDSNNQISAYGATGTPPSFIYINYGTNEALQAASTSDLQTAVTGCLTSLRAAAPGAHLLIGIPFGLPYTGKYSASYPAALTSGFNAYTAANPGDSKVHLVNFGTAFAATIQNAPYIYSDNVHPLAAGHAIAAPMVMGALANALASQSGTQVPIHQTGARGGIR